MKRATKKLISYFLAVTLLLGSVFIHTSFVSEANQSTISGLDNISHSTDENGNETYMLDEDINGVVSITLAKDETVILDGQGYNIRGLPDHSGLEVSGEGTLILKDINILNARSSLGTAGIMVQDDVNLILLGAVTINGSASGGMTGEGQPQKGSPALSFNGSNLVFGTSSTIILSGGDGIYDGAEGGNALDFYGEAFMDDSNSCTFKPFEGVTDGVSMGYNGSSTKGYFPASLLLNPEFTTDVDTTTLHNFTIKNVTSSNLIPPISYTTSSDTISDITTLPVACITDYVFEQWYSDEDLTTPLENGTDITSDMVIYAKYHPTSCTMTFDSQGGSTIDSETVEYSNVVTSPTAPTKEGFTFIGWYTDVAGATAYDFSKGLTDNLTVYAKWQKFIPPTEVPTTAPTEAPTTVPTEAPTTVPTEAPTTVPTETPTTVPTEASTTAPTEAPTTVPTEAPTTAPTEAPTTAPTEAPTTVPTEAPTTAPTQVPTTAPTEAPTTAPTKAPTTAPTEAPTVSIFKQISSVLNTKNKSNWSDNGIRVYWDKVANIDGYEVFASDCKGKNLTKKDSNKTVRKNRTTTLIKKVNGKKLNKNKSYKVQIKAYVNTSKGKRKYVGEALVLHVTGSKNPKYTNAKSINTNIKKISLLIGNSKTLSYRIVKEDKTKKLLPKEHGSSIRYFSSNPLIARVNRKGKITAIASGKCEIYAVTLNGMKTSTTVTVK